MFFSSQLPSMILLWIYPCCENVSKVSTRFEFLLWRFRCASDLVLLPVELDAEFDSESNGDIFRSYHWSKNGTLPRYAVFCRFCCKGFGVAFTILSELTLKVDELSSELNSALSARFTKYSYFLR